MTQKRRRYKTIAEYEKDIAFMHRKAQVFMDEKGLSGTVEQNAQVMFRGRYTNAVNGLRILKERPELENWRGE